MEEQQEKKVDTVTAILWVMFLLFIYALDFLLTLIGVGLVFNSLINIPVAGLIQFWTRWKGIKGTASLAGSIVEFIPVINALPIRTGTMIVTIYLANKPIAAKAAGAAKGKMDANKEKLAKERVERLKTNRAGATTGHENWTPTEGKANQAPHPQTPQLQPAPITINPTAQ